MASKEPEYPLESIHEAARLDNVVFRERPAQDIQNLGYFRDGAREILQSLGAADFDRVEDYSQHGRSKKCDVYLPAVENDRGSHDELYIKLQLQQGWLIIYSFHLQH